MYYKWSKEFMAAGKQRLAGNTKRQANSTEVKDLRKENDQLKELVAELALKNKCSKKACWDGKTGREATAPYAS
jgi:transposase